MSSISSAIVGFRGGLCCRDVDGDVERESSVRWGF